jgi:hypothetical protein
MMEGETVPVITPSNTVATAGGEEEIRESKPQPVVSTPSPSDLSGEAEKAPCSGPTVQNQPIAAASNSLESRNDGEIKTQINNIGPATIDQRGDQVGRDVNTLKDLQAGGDVTVVFGSFTKTEIQGPIPAQAASVKAAVKPVADRVRDLPHPGQMNLFPVQLDEHPALVEILKARRVVILSSFEHKLAFSAAYSLVRDGSFDGYSRRLLVLSQQDDENDLTIAFLESEGLRECSHQIFLVEIISSSSFVDSLRNDSLGSIGTLRALLEERKVFIVCALSSEVLGLSFSKRGMVPFQLDHQEIPFLRYKLAQALPLEEVERTQPRLEEQWKRGLWADFSSKEDFYRQVSELLAVPGQLEQEVERRDLLASELSAAEATRQLKPIRPEDILRDDNGLRRVVLYAATYFRNLGPTDFDAIVRLLLGEDTVQVEKQIETLDDRRRVQIHKEPVPRKLVELWDESSDRVLAECALEALPRGENSGIVMEFAKSYLRTETRLHLESKNAIFLARCFARLQENGLILRAEISSEVAESAIRLWLAQMKDLDRLLKDLLLRIVAQSDTELRRCLCDRLCNVVREILQTEALRGTIHRFIDYFFRERLHETALFIVLDLVRRLRFAPEFEAFFWMKRLLDEGNEEIQGSTYRCLFALAQESSIHLYDVLSAIRGWLPEPERRRFSPSGGYSLSFLPEYCVATAKSCREEHYGIWPSRYPLFSALSGDPVRTREKLEMLAGWLTHPGLEAVISANKTEPKDEGKKLAARREALAAFLADLVELWALILEGTAPEKAHPEARRLADSLFEVLISHLDRPQQIRIARRWQWRQQDYYQQAGCLPVGNRSERNALLAKRKKLLEVKSRFLPGGALSPQPQEVLR